MLSQDFRASDAIDDNDVVPMEIDDSDSQGHAAASETAMVEESTTIFVVVANSVAVIAVVAVLSLSVYI